LIDWSQSPPRNCLSEPDLICCLAIASRRESGSHVAKNLHQRRQRRIVDAGSPARSAISSSLGCGTSGRKFVGSDGAAVVAVVEVSCAAEAELEFAGGTIDPFFDGSAVARDCADVALHFEEW
jgi:hypothetical protein